MRYINDLLFDAVAVASTDTITSEWVQAESAFEFSVQVVTAGSNPNGALKVQFSNDPLTQAGGPSSASDVASATVSTTNNGVYKIDRTAFCGMWLRLSYTNTSGSGTVSARIKTSGY